MNECRDSSITFTNSDPVCILLFVGDNQHSVGYRPNSMQTHSPDPVIFIGKDKKI